jgi:hypothetical protein
LDYSHYLGATADTTELYTVKEGESMPLSSQNRQPKCSLLLTISQNTRSFKITNLPSDDLSPYNVHKHLHDVQNKTDL